MTKNKNQKKKNIETQVYLIWREFGSFTRRLDVDPSKADLLVPNLQVALQRQQEILKPAPVEEVTWKAIGDLTRDEIHEGFGIAKELPVSDGRQPWPPRNMIPRDISAGCLTSIQSVQKYMARSSRNEAAARVVIDLILFDILGQIMDGHCEISAPGPSTSFQMETSLESNMVTVKGKDQRFRGTSDYTLWYGNGDGPEKAINLIILEAKAQIPAASDGQALGYMGCVHQERRLKPGRSAIVYGVVTDGEEWRFCRINDEGRYSWDVEISGKLSGDVKGKETGYAKIATLLGFIMGQAMILSPYTTRMHSKETSREDDELMTG
ncbi:uncharacterized protein N7477_000935 [Penicillium maclennaniae]|uniref:uncharacterized protein n=1 Tax=Penicillium maclennaniae TaxID=1343394 RepID=UPI00253F7ECB|nr:uncharacterized protein N7477_000935 [Penicillium maclennaniae]KAJ5684590.1 hypothetical protein N7477_000935 [Penicillium maclennaniae]